MKRKRKRLGGLALPVAVAVFFLGMAKVVHAQVLDPSSAPAVSASAAAANPGADPGAAAQTPASLPQMRMQLRHHLLAATLPEKQAYRESLFSLEKQFASGGDFKGAIRARDERVALDEEISIIQQQLMHPPRVLSPSTRSDAVELKLEDATLSGATLSTTAAAGARAADSVPILTAWSTAASASASATWQLPSLPAGGYEIHLKYTLKPGMTPVLEFKENYYRLTATLPQDAAADVADSDNKDKNKSTQETLLGTLRVRDASSPQMLTLTVRELADPAGLNIMGITLRPATR